MRRLLAPVLLLSCLPLPALAAEAALRPIAIDDFARLRRVAEPQRSPEGDWVAFTVGTTDVEKDKRDTDLWMARWDGSREVRLTSSPDSESTPRWSPDGRFLAFLAARGEEEEKKKGAQVWLLDRAGGEAQQLTDVKGGVADFAWSPDSTRLALVVADPDPDEDPEKKEGWKRKAEPPIVLDRYHFKQDREGYLKRLYTHLALFDVAAKKLEPLTSGQVDDEEPAWSPDGQQIAFLSKRAHADPDRTFNADLFAIEAKAGAAPRQLTKTARNEGGTPAWSPDGRRIAVQLLDEDRFYAYDMAKLAVVPAEGGDPFLPAPELDRAVSGIRWSADGRALLFAVEDDRASWIGRVPAEGGKVERLTQGREVATDPSPGRDGGMALLVSRPTEPTEVWALERGALRRLTHQNDALRAELRLGITEDFTSVSADGTEVHGLMVKPADYAAGRRYPTLLHIHGGPNGQDDYSFGFDRELYAAAGYVVLEINYRGSSGRGEVFQKAIYADWGGKEVVDLIGAVDEAIRRGVADPDRLGLGGWSYGGILTNYVIASDPRFKAGVSGASSSLQLSMYGLDQYIVQYETELGRPWEAQEAWLKVSYPFFHADRIRTPTLFLCGMKDFNVPLAGVEQMYQALESLGVETQLVLYPDQFHGLTRPSYQRDRYERFLGWWNRFLMPAPAAAQ